MKKTLAVALSYFTFFVFSVFAQTPTPTPEVKEDVVVINTRLIQIDAVVTDKDGKQVRDLKAEDFEVFQNDEEQKITNFSYITVVPAESSSAESVTSKDKKSLPPVPSKLKPEQVRRTIALVVDDLGLSFSSAVYTRKALKKFVDEQMLPGDLVAVIRTRGGIGALQQFTNDKRQLYAAIEKVQFYPGSRPGVSPFDALSQGSTSQNTFDNIDSEADIRQSRDTAFVVGTLGALQYVVKGVGTLPGRKAVILFSDGFGLTIKNERGGIEENGRIASPLRRLIDDANRAGVVINAIDPRGVVFTGFTEADSLKRPFSPDSIPFREVGRYIQQTLSQRFNQMLGSEEGPSYISDNTGGRFFKNTNDISGAIEKALESEKGYYLLGYEPDEATFDPAKRRYNELRVKIKRPGLKVKYRNGFFGVSDEENKNLAAKETQTPQQKLFGALLSPFGRSDVNLRLNALFTNDVTNGSLIQSLLHVDAKDLKFTDEPDGKKKAVFDVIAYTFGDNGIPIDHISKNFTLSVKPDSPTHRRILEKGIVYFLNLPVKKPGPYQLRIALRDAQSEKIGAANQFIEIPNLKKGQLTVSGLILANMSLAGYQKSAPEQSPNAGSQNEEGIDPQSDTALRRFRPGTALQYSGTIFNAKLNSGQPQLNTQMRVFRDGNVIFETKPAPVGTTGQSDMQRLSFGGAVSLPPNMEPGDYVLQVVATDALAKEKRQIAMQWIDFEIIN